MPVPQRKDGGKDIVYTCSDTESCASQRGAEAGPKRLAVRQLKRYASWVQSVVRQLGLYPVWAF